MLKTASLATAASLLIVYTAVAPFMLLFLNAFNDTGEPWLMPISLLYFMFCVQLFIQAILMLVQIKYAERFVQRLIAAGVILLLPIVVIILLSVVASGTSSHLSNHAVGIVLLAALTLQVVASVWLWILIGSTKKPTPTTPPEQVSLAPVAPPVASEALEQQQPAATLPAPVVTSHKKLGFIILFIPGGLLAFTILLAAIAPVAFTSLPTSTFNLIFTSLGGLFALLFLPCIITGIVLIVKSR